MKMKSPSTILAVLLVLAGAFSTPAQSGGPFTLNWFTLDGGGGSCSGGLTPAGGTKYNMSGTIGQKDAGAMSGGTYTLAGGFWSMTTIVPSQTNPKLSIELLPGRVVRVFWTRPAEGYVLEEVGAITSSPVTAWSPVPVAAYQTNATHISFTIPMPTGNRLFRLR